MLYFGGKSRWIDIVFASASARSASESERCCGTAVMTLNNPEPAVREVICDLNAFICNFYRSIVGDYEQTAYHADWPTNHFDLTARHRWMLAQGPELSERIVADPDDFDPKIAGWSCWRQSSWIGHGWCDGNVSKEARPDCGGTNGRGGGQGVQQQRINLPGVEDKHARRCPTAATCQTRSRGIKCRASRAASACSTSGTRIPQDQVPFMKHSGPGGKRVCAQRVADGRAA